MFVIIFVISKELFQIDHKNQGCDFSDFVAILVVRAKVSVNVINIKMILEMNLFIVS